MSNMIEYNGISAFHPGYYVAEIIEDMGISQTEFALRMGLTAKTVSLLVAGKCRLSNDIAQKLSVMTGTGIDVWMNLQKEHDKKIFEIEQEKSLKDQEPIARIIDYSFFVDVGKLPMTRKIPEKIINLCNYLHIADLHVLEEDEFLVNFRSGVASFSKKNHINARAWVQTAINVAQGMDVRAFNIDKLKEYLPEIREMTLQKPDVFLPRLRSIFSDCGVAFVLLPNLKNSGINGAVKWIHQNRVVLALNDRRNYADTFWFTLFHEIKHVLQQKVKRVFLSFDSKKDDLNATLEAEADHFAQDYLIPPEGYSTFLSAHRISLQRIKNFAEAIKIHPGIIVGRLQHDQRISPSFGNQLKEKYKIVLH